MKAKVAIAALVALLSIPALAQQSQGFLSPLRNARYIYVTSYSGSQLSLNPLPEDRAAIIAVQNALQQSGRFTVVYQPQEADMVVAVMSRPSEDVLAVYDLRSLRGGYYLWRSSEKAGLSAPNMPLVQQLESALAATRTPKV
jgi:6-phosphogluconolactonase (cycloisomerase 2 family)